MRPVETSRSRAVQCNVREASGLRTQRNEEDGRDSRSPFQTIVPDEPKPCKVDVSSARCRAARCGAVRLGTEGLSSLSVARTSAL